MSNEALSQVWDTPCGSPTDKLVFACLADHQNEKTGKCCPSVSGIARECDLSERSVARSLQRLKSAGLIDWTKERGQHGDFNSYVLRPRPRPKPCRSVTPDTVSPLTLDAASHDTQSALPLTGCPSTPDGVSDEPEGNQKLNQKEPKRARFVPPTRDELNAEAKRIEMPPEQVDAFVDHFVSNGWKVGRNPMVDWPAALRNWHRRSPAFVRSAPNGHTSTQQTGRGFKGWQAAQTR